MRLKQLEIKGFKSFANHTVINFEEDVIGIVGPNGSGKSNIVDAIRWVLGEQKSRELRLDQMSSVIFNGTKKRKAGGLAQVSLTFENTKNLLPTEYHTVTITRMLYRTGESEYQLNGVTCRLKDITSLFLDTGIGSNSYAIIALGMVDDILTDKDNSRRKMFEQAAGISKYKVRKRQTINKLNSTKADLDRVEDLLFEIEGNLKSLEKQARRTKKYFELKAEYKQSSIDLALLKISSLKEKHKSIKQKLEAEQDKYRQFDVDINQLESKLEAERKANLDKEKALSDRQRELNEIISRIRGMENDKRMQHQKLQFVGQNQEKLTKDIAVAEQKLQQLEEDINHYRTQVNSEKRIEAELEDKLEAANAHLEAVRKDHGQIKSGMDSEIQEQQAAERTLFELEKQKAILSNQIQGYHQELDRSDVDIDLRKKEVAGLKEKITYLEEEEQKKRKQLHNLQIAEDQRQQDLQRVQQQQEELQKKSSRINRSLDASRNEHKLIKSMVENLEGFPESIRFLSNSSWNNNAQLLSDLIYVKEEYRIAIENYLEPYLNYYVVENAAAAYQAIRLLGQAQQGKANFLILDAFDSYDPPLMMGPDMLNAIELVETDPAYRKLVSYLLENVVITDSEEIGGELPEGNRTILSKSGRIIRRKHSLSGGSVGLFEGKKIGRKKSLEILSNKIKELEIDAKNHSDKQFELKNKENQLKQKRATPEIQREQEALNKITQEKITFQTRLENFEAFIQTVNQKKEEINLGIAELQSEERSINRQLLEKEDVIDQIKEKIASMDGSFRKVADELSQASSDYNQKNIDFIRQQNKVGSIQRELNYRQTQFEETEKGLADARRNIQDNELEKEQINDHLEELEKRLVAAYETRKEKEATLTTAEQVYFDARGGINEIEDTLRKLTRSQQETQILVNQLKEKFNDVKYQISAVAQRLRIEFEIDINEIVNQPPPEGLDMTELEMKVERMKKRLDNYGEINPMAVEAYDEMKERFDSITKQRDDILQAKESLLQTIKEIEETATEQFLSSFEKARLYFIEVFRSLFTEDDNCDLMLLEPDDPLESKIEIVAKPKGKRPQTINQLSGGEKTLTATALLFALYLLKPAPFCIFDEVDAPLDDANINKFNKIIKKFSKESQFIIVTHNKLTMAAVDTIYGVYMAEQGVSGVSQVDFRDYDHMATFERSAN
jgi:chromosome segregation protein